MKTKTIAWGALLILLSLLFCVAVVDRPFALLIHQHFSSVTPVAQSCTSALQWLFAFSLSKYLYAFVLLAVGLALNLLDRKWTRARYWYFVGGTLFMSRLASGTLKNLFERVRPHEFIASGNSADFFVDGAGSFPSGHAAFYFGLALPLAILYPGFRWLFLTFAAVASLCRVFEEDHYLSDLLASALVALVLTYGFAKLLRIERSTVAAPVELECSAES